MPLTRIKSESIDTSGNLDIDSATLFVDTVNNRIGIGTTSPGTKLVIEGGTSEDQFRLGTGSNYYRIGRESSSTGFLTFYGTQPGATGYVFSGVDGERMRIDGSGNIGIGTGFPGYRLDVISNDTAGYAVRIRSNVTAAAAIFQFTDNGGTSENGYIKVTDADVMSFATGSTPRLQISSGGDVSIGTSASNGRLLVEKPASSAGWIINAKSAGVVNDSGIYVDASNNAEFAARDGSSNLTVRIGSAGNSWLTSSGNLGIGTSSPAVKCDVVGSVRVVAVGAGSSGSLTIRQNSGDTVGGYIQWVNHANDIQRGFIHVDTSGNMTFSGANYFYDTNTLNSIGTYNNTAAGSTVIVTSGGEIRRTSSSIKYKKDIEDLDPALADNAVANLRPVWYRSKQANGDDKAEWSHIGLIAEEVDLIEKRLVRYRTVEVTTDENGNRVETLLETPEPEDVDYARLSVLLLDKVKRQDALISALETRLSALENTTSTI